MTSEQVEDTKVRSDVHLNGEEPSPRGMSKNQDKNVRSDVHLNRQSENIHAAREPMKRQPTLCVKEYQHLYPSKKLMLVNDLGSRMEMWLSKGAELVPRRTPKQVISYKNKRSTEEWVSFCGGSKFGTTYRQYLLMIDPEKYHKIVTGPAKHKQNMINEAIGVGGVGGEQIFNQFEQMKMKAYRPKVSSDGEVGYKESYGSYNAIT